LPPLKTVVARDPPCVQSVTSCRRIADWRRPTSYTTSKEGGLVMDRFASKAHAQLAIALLFGCLVAACNREPRASANTDTIEERYGLAGAYSDLVRSDNGTIAATIIPITLSDGRTAQLVIPKNQAQGQTVFLRDQDGLSPVVLENPRVSREEFIRSQPRVVER